MESILYEGTVYWAYDYEIEEMDYAERYFIRHLSFSPPLSKHQGYIRLTNHSIIIDGEEEGITIFLSDITQLSLGFDKVYSRASSKNFGVFWKPLKIEFDDAEIVYLAIDYRNGFTSNDKFFELLKEIC